MLEKKEFKSVARILELCACHNQGIKILNDNLVQIMNLINRFLREPVIEVRYPTATVLLDLTANETCIEKVG